ncbi:hypothetical protein DPMN_194977 [Dreissena polymorpha]|uniref:Uncharacterized protein n=1 Tax=Dreissena polymorpha TaxID=45954 RepID=A0A9D3Y1R3_DREPO|nr:hypothetical protein DPMN_194977 [Dreissena polymorpha]
MFKLKLKAPTSSSVPGKKKLPLPTDETLTQSYKSVKQFNGEQPSLRWGYLRSSL